MEENDLNLSAVKMNVFEAIATRRSIRKFMAKDVPMEILGIILDAGRYAPSAGNLQSWKFIIVKDNGNKQAIAEACMQQMWIAEAPVVIVVCAEVEKTKMFYGIRGERMYVIQNCAAATQNMLLTAHALGLASTWVSAFDDDMLRRAIGAPEDVRPQAVLPIGYPDEIVPAPIRYTLENTCFFEAYGRKITNIARVMQNPVVFDKLTRLIKFGIDLGKEAITKKKK
ncbi:MAG: nitroreductase family protein [Candidatus Woesearchaeota archaeon]